MDAFENGNFYFKDSNYSNFLGIGKSPVNSEGVKTSCGFLGLACLFDKDRRNAHRSGKGGSSSDNSNSTSSDSSGNSGSSSSGSSSGIGLSFDNLYGSNAKVGGLGLNYGNVDEKTGSMNLVDNYFKKSSIIPTTSSLIKIPKLTPFTFPTYNYSNTGSNTSFSAGTTPGANKTPGKSNDTPAADNNTADTTSNGNQAANPGNNPTPPSNAKQNMTGILVGGGIVLLGLVALAIGLSKRGTAAAPATA